MKNIIYSNPIVAILRNVQNEILIDYVQALYHGGLRSFEISFVTPNATAQIQLLKSHLPTDALVGAGTILTPKAAEAAAICGADYLLSPATDEIVLKYCQANNIPFMPGVFSPSDVAKSLQYGFEMLKLFPAASLPGNYVKNLKGPFPSAEFVAVGGVNLNNALEYFNNGFAGVGIGSSLVEQKDFDTGAWRLISEKIAKQLSLLP